MKRHGKCAAINACPSANRVYSHCGKKLKALFVTLDHIFSRARLAIALCCGAFLGLHCAAAPILEFNPPAGGVDPEGITLGPDGNLWFVEYVANQIGRIDTNGVITEFPIPGPGSLPIDIVTGPDGNLWFTQFSGSSIGQIATNGTIKQFPLPTGVIGHGLTLGPDNRLWVLDLGAQTYIPGTPTNGGVVALAIGTNGPISTNYYNSNLTIVSRPVNIVTGPDNRLYFTEGSAGKIGIITTNGVISELTLPFTNVSPCDITVGPDGNLWFTEYLSNQVARLDTNLNLTEFALPPITNSYVSGNDRPYGIITGPDGNLWYSDKSATAIGRITPGATNISVTQYSTPTTNSNPTYLAVGADSNIWFGEFPFNYSGYQSHIARFTIAPISLSIQITNTNAVISWTTNLGPGSVLLTNADLTTTNWGTLVVTPTVVSNRYVVTNPIPPTTNLFFRLIE